MSVSFWPIVGYGIQLDLSMFDEAKVENLLNMRFDEISLTDIAVKLTESSKVLTWADGADMETGTYIYLPAALPWHKEYHGLAPETIENEIFEILKPYLKESQTEKTIKDAIDYVCVCGCA